MLSASAGLANRAAERLGAGHGADCEACGSIENLRDRREGRASPGDMCQCPHYGYIFEGEFRFTYPDGTEEIYQSGDVFYAPAPRFPIIAEDTRTDADVNTVTRYRPISSAA